MQSRAPFVVIILTLMLDAIGIGLILPVMPELIRSLQGAGISEAAVWGGLLSFTYAGMQFLCGPLVGNLSDRFGRRPVLIFAMVAMGLDYLLMAVAPTLWLLFVARLVSGITGATFSTASAYLADISPPEKRAANFGLVGAAFGVGFILGPAMGGMLGELGPRAPFLVAGALALGNGLFAWIYLRESLPRDRRRAFEWRRANPLGALRRVAALPQLGGLVAVRFLYSVANNVYPAIWTFYTILAFGWSPGLVGASLAAYGLSLAFVQGVVIRPVLRAIGEWRTAIFGLVMTVTGMCILAAIESGVWIFVFMPVLALGELAGPAMQGLMSNRVDDREQGELQGVLASIAGIAAIISPLVMTAIFRVFTADDAPVFLPGAPFLAAAVLSVGALLLLVRASRARAVA